MNIDLTLLARELASRFIDQPNRLAIVAALQRNGQHVYLRIRGCEADTGRLVGSSGRNVKALGVVLNHVAKRQGQTVTVKVLPGLDCQPLSSPEIRISWLAMVLSLTAQVRIVIGDGPCRLTIEPEDEPSRINVVTDLAPEVFEALAQIVKAVGKTQGRELSFHAQNITTPVLP